MPDDLMRLAELVAGAADKAADEMRGGYSGPVEHAIADGLAAFARHARAAALRAKEQK